MPIPVTCECGQDFLTRDENAGRRARCPDCGREFMVPDLAPIPVEFVDLEPWRLPQRSNSGKAIASLVLGLCVIGTVFTGIPAILLGLLALRDIRQSRGPFKGKALAIAGIVLGIFSTLLVFMHFPTPEYWEGARRSQCVNNLKQIALAMHNYHSMYDGFPPAAITDKQGRPLLSWRVAILPHIELQALYDKFHLDEPWNSPHNFALINEMPVNYRCPSELSQLPGMTNYQVILDPHSIFRPDFQPMKIKEITDGTSNTLLVGESLRPVYWTAPVDLPFDPAVLHSGLGSVHPGGFNVAFADGMIHFLKTGISPIKLEKAILRDDRVPDDGPHSF